jgi:hypothetical protein
MKGHTMIEKKITFYGGNFELIRAIDITRPVPECWVPPSEFDACNAIQATSNGIVIGLASRVGVTWHYNLVGGQSHLPKVGATQADSLKEIATFFSEALLLE